MSKRVINFLIGLMLFVVSRQDRPKRADESHECQVQMVDKYFFADCAKDRIKTGLVPQDLDEKIHGLDISNNRIKPLNSDSFKRYKSLVRLNISYSAAFNTTTVPKQQIKERIMLPVLEIDKDTFLPLTKLQQLDLTYSFCGTHAEFNLPTRLSYISFGALYLKKDLNFENLHYLDSLNLFSNELTTFPKLYTKLPVIKWIVLYDNPLKSLTVDDVAPLCSLRRLEINAKDKDTHIDKESFFCHCKRLMKWCTDFDIIGLDLSCFPSHEPCDLKFDQSLLEIREKCLARIKTAAEAPEAHATTTEVTVPVDNGTSAITPRPPPPPPTPPSKFIMNLSTLLLILFFILSVLFIIYISLQLYQRQGRSRGLKAAEELEEEEELEELEEEEGTE